MFSLIKRQNVLSAAVALFAVAFLALPQLAQAATTGTLYPNGQGTYTAWVGDESDIDETGTPDCEDGNADGNDNIMGDNGPDRESVLINLSGIPDGSTITSVDINVYYRDASGGGSDGTFQTFARLDGSDYDSGANIAASSSTCAGTTQTVDIPDTVKSGSTVLEIGALKTDDDTSNVWVGTLRADITYSPVQYTIDSSAGAGGSITPAGSTVVDGGSNQTYNSTPSSGYILSDVLVDAGSVGRMNSYTFSSVAANHTIESSFEGGFYNPSSYSDGDSDVGTPGNASASDDSYAVVNDQNDEIDYGGFGGLGVPLNAISIDGIELALEGNRPSGSRTIDFSLSWDGGVTWTSAQNLGSGMGTGDSTVIAGGASDTWGRSWTPAEFDNGNFMVRLDAITSGAGHTLNIDQLSVKVFYTGDVTPPNLAVVTPIGTTESHQPDFTFSTDEDGTLAVGGGCTSTATSATVGNNTIPFGFLASGTYSACTITVTDAYGNSAVLAVPEFTISNAAPASGGGGGGGGGNGLFTLVNNNSDVGTQPGSVLGAFTTADEQNQQSQEQQGAVLGASTNALAASCSADKHLLTSNLGMGKTNSADQVKLLQQFLNQELGANLPVSGAFGDMTLASVKAFQAAHTADILTPWGITDPTGYVGVTTRRMIDILVCGADYAIPQLPN